MQGCKILIYSVEIGDVFLFKHITSFLAYFTFDWVIELCGLVTLNMQPTYSMGHFNEFY